MKAGSRNSKDAGAVGRIPVLIPVEWTADGWPVLGHNGASVDEVLPMPKPGKPRKFKTDIVASDEFDNGLTRHIFSYEDVGTGITAGLSVETINDLLKRFPPSQNLLQNGNFESGGNAPWTVNGGDQLARLTVEREPDGRRVLKVSQRKATIAGPSQKIGDKLERGVTYRVFVRVRYGDFTDAAGRIITAV